MMVARGVRVSHLGVDRAVLDANIFEQLDIPSLRRSPADKMARARLAACYGINYAKN